MLEYVILYCIIVFFTLKNIGEQNIKWKNINYFISVALLVVLMGFRHQSMGVDLRGYLPAFDTLSSYDWNRIISMDSYLNYEKGYVVFNKIIGIICQDRQFFLFCCAAISIIPISIYIYKTSKLPLVSLILYLGLPCFLAVFSALRQAIAIAICAVALLCAQKKKRLVFVALVLLATLFHSSAVLVLFAYPLYHYKPSSSVRIISIILLPVSYIFRVPIFTTLSRLIKDNASIDNNNSVTLFLAFSLIYIFSFAIINEKDCTNNGWLNLFWVACFCQSLAGLNNITLRAGYYFMLPVVSLLPNILHDNNQSSEGKYAIVISSEKQRVLVLLFVYMSFMAFGLFSLKTGSWTRSYPYFWFWENP